MTKPHKPQEKAHIYTEGINYFETNENSILGKGDRDTLKFLKATRIDGIWLNLAAGDGRYNTDLLKKADVVIASDIDKSALSKLFYCTPNRYKPKLKMKAFNIVKRFPFKDGMFDGIFCTGVLHLFPKTVFKRIAKEMDRVLRSGGTIILDFAVDIRRTAPDGRAVGSESRYKLKEAETLLKDVFSDYKIKMIKSNVDNSNEGNPPYRFQCNYILLDAVKPTGLFISARRTSARTRSPRTALLC